VSLTRDFDNVIVTRTFSKVGGLAGLRLGFLVANPNVVEGVNRVRGAFEVNAAAIAMGCLVLDRPDIGDRYLREIEEGRAVLAATVADLGLGFPPCPTNFQLVEFPEGLDTRRVVDELFKRKYLVKGAFTAPSVRRCIRVTLGDAEVMRGFAEALRDVLVLKGEQCGH
jgi:histidinol-phosphate aminotransferase